MMQDHLQRLLTRSAEIFAIMRRAANRLWDRTISTKQAIKANSPLGFWQINEEQPSIGVDPDDFDTHISGIRDAASASLGLWLSYIFFLFYLAVAVASITHRDLLVEGVLKLPILGIDLPMVAFFILGPILMIVSHAYTMIHFIFLGAKVGQLNLMLERQKTDHAIAEKLRWRLPVNIFVQLLAGPSEVREGKLGRLLLVIAGITLVIAPVLLLLFFQLQFLPYHSQAITWFHRLTVLADLVLLSFLWPLGGTAEIRWPLFHRPGLGWFTSVCVLLFSFAVSTFPGEVLHDRMRHIYWIPLGYLPNTSGVGQWYSLHDILFNGTIDPVLKRRTSPFSNTLVVLDVDLGSSKTNPMQENASPKVSLRERDLAGAMFANANLRGADFVGANLRGANFEGADLSRAVLCDHEACASLQNTIFRGANLRGLYLVSAKFTGASLDNANFQKTTLSYADLHGATMREARFEGAIMNEVRSRGAFLRRAHLDGAVLDYAYLEGADLIGASLTGTSLRRARLAGASLGATDLRGAKFDQAQMLGTQLGAADLRGASLEGARLQGAIIAGPTSGASFIDSYVWRAELGPITRADDAPILVQLQKVQTAAIDFPDPEESKVPWTVEKYDELRKEFESIPFYSGGLRSLREDVLRRIERLDPRRPLPDEDKKAEVWKRFQGEQAKLADYERAVAAELQAAGCEEAAGAFIIDGLLRAPLIDPDHDSPIVEHAVPGIMRIFQSSRLSAAGENAISVVETFLPMRCYSASELGELTKRKLRILQRELSKAQATAGKTP